MYLNNFCHVGMVGMVGIVDKVGTLRTKYIFFEYLLLIRNRYKNIKVSLN